MRLRKFRRIISTLSIIFYTNAVKASLNNDSTLLLNEVIVVDDAVKVPINLLPLDTKIVPNEIIENSTENNVLPILQNRIPGMFVTERGLAGFGVSGGSAGSVSIRGVGGGNKVLFMIDGQPQWAGVFGHALPDTYVTNDIERVEVVSGASSLLYGSGAMGGSINLITRRAYDDGVSGSIRVTGGSYGSISFGAKESIKYDRFGIVLAACYESSDGNRHGMGYWLTNQYANLKYKLSDHWESGLNLILTQTKSDNPGATYRSIPLDMWSKQFRLTTSLFLKNHFMNTFGGIQAYYNYGKHDIDDGLDNNNMPRSFLFHSKDYNMGVTLYQTIIPWKGNYLSLGIDFKHWGGRAYNTDKSDKTESSIVDKHVNEIAGYVMMQQNFLRGLLSCNAGIRLEHSAQFGNVCIPLAGLIVKPSVYNNIKIGYGKGFRSPTIRELYMYAPRNPELRPESLYNFDIEFRQWLINRRLEIGVSFYYINGEDMIQVLVVDGKMKNVNTGKFINKGFELDATFNIRREWSISANYAYLHTDKRIVGAPKNKMYAEIDYKPGQWQFSVDMLSIFGLNTEQSVESYTTLSARAAYCVHWNKPLTVFVKGENLTATNYQINYGYPMPRATVMAGVEWKF